MQGSYSKSENARALPALNDAQRHNFCPDAVRRGQERRNARSFPALSDGQRNHFHFDAVRRREGLDSKIRIAILNIGTLTGKGREVAAVLRKDRYPVPTGDMLDRRAITRKGL